MCGIIGYTGQEEGGFEILHKGLIKLEYRGYDSCGIACVMNESGEVALWRNLGAPSESISLPNYSSNCGIAHTRWATHGEVSMENTHPHHSMNKEVCLVHNGVIENSDNLRDRLEEHKIKFYGETDSEVLVNLIAFYLEKSKKDFLGALRLALNDVEGTYGLAALFKGEPDNIYIARRSSPIALGIGNGENYVVSDVDALPENIEKIIYLKDGNIALLKKDNFKLYDFNNEAIEVLSHSIRHKKTFSRSLGEFSSYLEKEIFKQPCSIRDTMRGRFTKEFDSVVLGGINLEKKIKRVLFLGCGTAYNAGLLGKYYMENIAGLPAAAEISSEYKYKNTPPENGTLVVAISQSGETADTLSAVKEAQDKGLDVIAITNTVMSSIARQVEEGIYQRIGPEISVASTKAFTSQVTLILMLAIALGRKNNLSEADAKKYIQELRKLPELMEQTLLNNKEVCKGLAAHLNMVTNINFLGRQYMYPIALEAALKLKELAYICTHGYASGELKHGPLASVDRGSFCFVIAPEKALKEKNVSTMKEINSRKGRVVLIKQENQDFPKDCYYRSIKIPQTKDFLLPILSVIPMQLFSLYSAEKRGFNVDKPRNLAKSVTVE